MKLFVFSRRRFAAGALALVLIGSAGTYVYSRSDDGFDGAIVVHPKAFMQQVSLSGKVIAAQEVDLGFAGSGRIAGVYADVGDTVAAGKLLAEIENGDLRAAVSQKQAALAAQEAKLASLRAGTRPESIAVSQAALASAESSLAQSQRGIVDAIRSAYAVADDAVRNKTDQFVTNPRSSSPSLDFPVTDSQTGTRFLEGRVIIEGHLRLWQASGAALTTDGDMTAAVREVRDMLGETARLLADGNAVLNRAITTTGVSAASIDGWIADVAAGRTALETAAGAVTAAQTSYVSATASRESARKSLALAQAGATREDIDAQLATVAAARADVENAQAQLTKTLITAPFSGIVTNMDAKRGSIVSANTAQVSLQSRGTFQIEGYVPEINIALVRRGQLASITLDAYGTGTTFEATVASVDPAETVRDGVSTYRIVLQFARPDERVRSGMTANILITAQERADVISVPLRTVVRKDGRSFVTVLEKGKPASRTVETGEVSSAGEIEIVSGLSDGDTVIH